MRISIIAFTDNGMGIANTLLNSLKNIDLINDSCINDLDSNFNVDNDLVKNDIGLNLNLDCVSVKNDVNLTRCKKGNLFNWVEENFSNSDVLVFIGAIGIAVRAISKYIESKVNDPAVIVIDDLGNFTIPLLSGHIGGANEIAINISKILNSTPIITTATDINDVFAIDTWAKKQGLSILNPEKIKLVSSKLLKSESIRIKSDYFIKGDLPKNINVFYSDDNFLDNLDNNYSKDEIQDTLNYDVIISHKIDKDLIKNDNILFLIPNIVTVGIGCKRNTPYGIIEMSILKVLEKNKSHILSLNSIASIDKKADEKGLLEFSKNYNLPFNTYSSEELNNVKGDFSKSAFVKSVVNVDNVCERSAIIQSNGKLIQKKCTGDGVAIALAIKEPVLYWEY